jgi:TfoX/Sxy family transcriptional regulator of competence genes
MATDPGTAAHVAEQMSAAGQIGLRKMFGEYAVYLQGKVVALICDNRLFVKRTAGTVPLLPDPQMGPPYPGAKPHIQADILLDDPDALAALVLAVAHDLPGPKPKAPKKVQIPKA